MIYASGSTTLAQATVGSATVLALLISLAALVTIYFATRHRRFWLVPPLAVLVVLSLPMPPVWLDAEVFRCPPLFMLVFDDTIPRSFALGSGATATVLVSCSAYLGRQAAEEEM